MRRTSVELHYTWIDVVLYSGDIAVRAHLSVITRKGQITLPADIRRSLGLKEGDTIAFRVEDGEVRLSPVRATLADGYQSIPALREPKPWKEIKETVVDQRAAEYARKGT